MTDVATTTQTINNPGNTDTIVVGEHSAYKDVESLIKGKAEADVYIQKLVEQNKEMQKQIEELAKRGDIVEQLKQIRQTGTEHTNTPGITEDAMKQIALKAMQEENARSQAAANLNDCKTALQAERGDVGLALKNKAAELGCTVEYLESIATTSPKAFKSMFGLKDKPVTFESVNFLQGSRATQPIEPNEVKTAKDLIGDVNNPKVMANFVDRALKDPSLLNNLKTW